MIKLYLSLLLCGLLFNVNAQAQSLFSAQSKLFVHQTSAYISESAYKTSASIPDVLALRYGMDKKDDIYYVAAFLLVDTDNADKKELMRLGVHINTKLGELWTASIPIHQFTALNEVAGIKYVDIGTSVDPMLDLSTKSANVDAAWEGLGTLSKKYSGKGVIIAVIDWGFDYTHPNFYDSLINRYRLVRAWDQNRPEGTPPDGYSYGAEFKTKAELLDAEHDDFYVYGPFSHGTHVAGIAAGGGAGTQYRGAAQEADLIFISLRRDGPSLVDAFQYINEYAESVEKPFVVNMSFGGHRGPHDGTDLQSKGLAAIAGPGKIFVGSCGNNGNSGGFHLDQNFAEVSDTLKTIVSYRTGQDNTQTISMWGSENTSFSSAILIKGNSGNIRLKSRHFHSTESPVMDTIMVVDTDTLYITMTGDAANPLNDKPNLQFEIRRSNTNIRVALNTYSDDGSHVHKWNCVRLNVRYTNWGMPFMNRIGGTTLDGYSAGDDYFGTGEPSGVSPYVISVGSYTSRNTFKNSSGNNFPVIGTVGTQDDISGFSSFGPTTDGRTKPEITAGGGLIVSSVSSFDNQNLGQHAIDVTHEGKTYGFEIMQGTSMSGPLVAGVVALMLEANPELEPLVARQIIKETAKTDEFTGEIDFETGDIRWGWGKLDALKALELTEKKVGIHDFNQRSNRPALRLYPNPASVTLKMDLADFDNKLTEIKVYDLMGKVLLQKGVSTANLHDNIYELDVSTLKNGIYLLKATTEVGPASVVFTIQK